MPPPTRCFPDPCGNRTRCDSVMRSLLAFVLMSLVVPAIGAEAWSISTIAGTGTQGFSGDGGPASEAQIDNPYGVVRGPDGAIWFCEYTGQRIRRISADGTISTVAGNGKKGYSGDGGPALEASFNLPHELRFDAARQSLHHRYGESRDPSHRCSHPNNHNLCGKPSTWLRGGWWSSVSCVAQLSAQPSVWS